MTVVVTLDVFSGRANPTWALSTDLAGELAARLEGVSRMANEERDRGLGYRGFRVLSLAEDNQARSLVSGDALFDPYSGNFVAGVPAIEDFLLFTGREYLDGALVEHIDATIKSPHVAQLDEAVVAATACPPCGGGDAPAYDPNYWNNDQTRLTRNNCYNYANNKATNTFAQPGKGSGQVFGALACGDVQHAAERDGLRSVPTYQASTSGWYVALVIWPGNDYHWYRQDNNGCWSHKPGQTAARNVDNSGNRISDPRGCDRGPYTSFCTYMVTNSGVRIA